MLFLGVLTTAIFLAISLYSVFFLANIIVPQSIDTGPFIPWPLAVGVDLLLIGMFSGQHSVMARATFKRWWTRIVPKAIERSVYALAANVSLALLLWFWHPIPQLIWETGNPAARLTIVGLFWFGWLLVAVAGLATNPLELLGLQQILDAIRGRGSSAPVLVTSGIYRFVRHPIYVGSLIGFWAAPDMTTGHLLFSTAMTVYIIFGLCLEERDLVKTFGDRYRRYQREVPILLPISKPFRRRCEARSGR